MHFADAMMFLVASFVLAAFDIQKAEVDGKVITPVVAQSTGAVRYVCTAPMCCSWLNGLMWSSHPLPFKCSIKPRSPDVETLVRAAMEDST